MSARKIILVALALGVAGATVQFARVVLKNRPQAVAMVEAPKPPLMVMVAATDVPTGSFLQPQHLRWQAWPDEPGVRATYMVQGTRTPEELQGAVLRQGMRAGEPVVEGKLVRPGDRGFLAAVLSPGTRAVSVPINNVSGVAGFIFPGDRVDLLLTQIVERTELPELKDRRAAETVLSDVRVIALDQRTNDQKGEAKVAQVATLEVTPRQAETVSVAMQMGTLSLSLRSLSPSPDQVEVAAAGDERVLTVATDAQTATRTATWDKDVSVVAAMAASVAPPAPESAPTAPTVNETENASAVITVQVVRGSDATELSFPQR